MTDHFDYIGESETKASVRFDSRDLPTGMVTFLFTDIVGSSTMWEKHPRTMPRTLERHDAILEEAATNHNGYVFKTVGDEYCIAFQSIKDALKAAVSSQLAFQSESWGESGPVHVRMAIHAGIAEEREGDYHGTVVNRVARLRDLAHGDQILLSQATLDLIQDEMPPNFKQIDLGICTLRGLSRSEHVYQLISPGLPTRFPPLVGSEEVPNNLPEMTTPFVGREQELEELANLLTDPGLRLVTIVGPGGMGKTRLAQALAAIQLRAHDERPDPTRFYRYPDGVFFVSLEDLVTEDQLLMAVMAALELKSAGAMEPKDQLLNYLKRKQLLLVLDNFEQLLEAVAILVDMVEAAPGIQLLVTSREYLAVHGEQLYPIAGMVYPESLDIGEEQLETYSAVRLFIQSARRMRPDFKLLPDDRQHVAEICRQLGGMPLALELAAGWVDLLTLNEISDEIQNNLDILASDLREFPERHRSLRVVFESTWARLAPSERRLFGQLSIFSGGFTRDAAAKVTQINFRQLAGFIRKSLIQYDRSLARYEIHPLLRQFGKAYLAEDPVAERAFRDRHCHTFSEAARRWHSGFKSYRQKAAQAEMELDYKNVWLAWEWALTHRLVEQMDALFDGLNWFCQNSGRISNRRIINQQASARLMGTSDANEKRLLAKYLVQYGAEFADALDLEYVRHGLSILKDVEEEGIDVRSEKASALERAALLIFYIGNSEEAYAALLESLRIYQQLEDWWELGNSFVVKSKFDRKLCQFEEAEKGAKESMRLCELSGYHLCLSRAKYRLAASYRARGILEEVQNSLNKEAAIILQDDVGTFNYLGFLPHLGFTHLYRGEYEQAGIKFLEATKMAEAAGDAIFIEELRVLEKLAAVYLGGYASVKEAEGIGNGVLEKITRELRYKLLYWAWIELVEYRFSHAKDVLERCIDCCRKSNNLEELGMVYAWLALAHRGMDQNQEAAQQLDIALSLSLDTGCIYPLMHGLPVAALWLADLGQHERAVEVYEVALQFPHVANAQLFEDLIGKEIKAIEAELPPQVVEEAKARGRELDPWELMAKLHQELSNIKDELANF